MYHNTYSNKFMLWQMHENTFISGEVSLKSGICAVKTWEVKKEEVLMQNNLYSGIFILLKCNPDTAQPHWIHTYNSTFFSLLRFLG